MSRYEDDKRELNNLIETLRDTNEKGGKLNLKLEEELLDKVCKYQATHRQGDTIVSALTYHVGNQGLISPGADLI